MAGVDDENNVGDGNGKIDFDDDSDDDGDEGSDDDDKGDDDHKGDDDGDGNGDVDAASAKIHQKMFPQNTTSVKNSRIICRKFCVIFFAVLWTLR